MSSRAASIFVADDNPILLQGLERALLANGYTVQTAATGAALLRLLEESPALPDLLLLDVMMPEMSGLDVLDELQKQERWADLPVMLITAATDEQLPVSALQHGAVDFLTKPFRLGELLARVEAHVARYHELQRARAESAVRLRVIDVVRDLNSVVTADEMFELVTTRVAEICGVASCSVLIDEGEGTVRMAASSAGEHEIGAMLPRGTYPELQVALDESKPLLVEDTAAAQPGELDPPLQNSAPVSKARSAVVVPFAISEHTRGIFLLRAAASEPQLNREALSIALQVVQGMTRALGRAQVFATLVEQRRQLHDLAHTDELTGCASRRAVMRYLADELDLARRRNVPLSVVLLDLDDFKTINDTHGHPAGDAVLRTFGEWLHGEGAHRVKDCVGRMGGDEFVVVLPETEAEGAMRFAERARHHLASMTFQFDQLSIRASLSGGIATWPSSEVETADELIGIADAALYLAKQAGRDRIRLAKRNGNLSIEAP